MTTDDKMKKKLSLIKKGSFDYKGIQEFIPQREPFLMLDSVIKIDVEKKEVICKKCISVNEWYFIGHFPDNHIMPGVLMVESMAQAASIIGEALTMDKKGKILFRSIEKCRFEGFATAGDVLEIVARVTELRHSLIKGECFVTKNTSTEKGVLVASCTLTAFKTDKL